MPGWSRSPGFRLLPVALVVLTAALSARTPRPRDDAWRDDIAFFAREFAANQVDFDQLYPHATFEAEITRIARAIPRTTDAELVLALMRLVAGAHVGHTYVRFPTDGPLAFHRLPIGLQWFADGLAVTAATDTYRDAIGLRVASIGTMTPDQLQAAVAPYIAFEHPSWLRLQSQSLMLSEEALRAVGQLDADGTALVTLERRDGTTSTLRMTPVPWTDKAPLFTVAQSRGLPLGPARADPGRYYRYEILPESKTLYIRYNRCADDPQRPFAVFASELFAAVDADPKAIDRVVIDLRANGGGDSRVINPLLAGLRARRPVIGRGHLYALVGPATFSSGLLAAYALKTTLRATLAGEPPGEKLNSYGEVRELTLPNSKLTVQYSTKYIRLARDNDALLQPDIVVTRSIADMLAGKDAVLEAVIGRKQ